jgi:hypothetical protein
LSLSPAVGEAVVSGVIYRDADSENLEFRLVYFHKKLGKVPDNEWRPVDGAYIYCAPTELILNKVRGLTGS